MVSIVNRRGHVWYQRLDVGAALRLRDLAGVDVMRLATGDDPMPDVATVVDCLYAILHPALGGITPKRFGKSLRGDVTPEQLAEMFVDAVKGFFHVPAPAKSGGGRGQKLTAEELWRDLWHAAGAAGVEPTSRTFGELATMADGIAVTSWIQTGVVASEVRNSVPGRKGPPSKAVDFVPPRLLDAAKSRQQSQELTADNLSQFARMMTG